MKFLLEFRNKYKINFDIIFKDKIYVRFYTKKMFPFKIWGNPISEESIYQLQTIMKFTEEIIEVLNK